MAADGPRLWALLASARRLLEGSDKLLASAVRCVALLAPAIAIARVPPAATLPAGERHAGETDPAKAAAEAREAVFAELALAIVHKVLGPIYCRPI
jgi:hypothetical protein